MPRSGCVFSMNYTQRGVGLVNGLPEARRFVCGVPYAIRVVCRKRPLSGTQTIQKGAGFGINMSRKTAFLDIYSQYVDPMDVYLHDLVLLTIRHGTELLIGGDAGLFVSVQSSAVR